MRVLGKIEGFVRGRSASYTTHLQTFDLATRELKRNARAKNTEGATLAFHQLTTSCVACHQSLRSNEP
jgi:cytochrome c556